MEGEEITFAEEAKLAEEKVLKKITTLWVSPPH